jgi:hypothetical protein
MHNFPDSMPASPNQKAAEIRGKIPEERIAM